MPAKLRLLIVTPALRSRKGNWVTATRWRAILRRLGHDVEIVREWGAPGAEKSGAPCDAMIALHARKSYVSIERFHRLEPGRPLIVTLTGTDLYGDLRESQGREPAWRALAWAHRLIMLQGDGLQLLPEELRGKTRVIRQSAHTTRAEITKSRRYFDVCVIGHLREVKDPFRAADASKLLSPESRLRVVHAGGALEEAMERRAKKEMAENPRYVWIGNRPPWQIRRLLKRSHAMVLSSEMEGGANVVSEAIVAGTAVISTRISGSIGMLGEDHPGYFEVGDTEALAELLRRCENDSAFLGELEERSRRLAPLFHPDREVETWRNLLQELFF